MSVSWLSGQYPHIFVLKLSATFVCLDFASNVVSGSIAGTNLPAIKSSLNLNHRANKWKCPRAQTVQTYYHTRQRNEEARRR